MVMGKVRVFNTIDQIDKESINSIADDGFFTYGWFKTLETTKIFNVELFYLVVYDEDRIVAIAPCIIDSYDKYFSLIGKHAFLGNMLHLTNKLRLFSNRLLVCYSPDSCHSKILLGNHSGEKRISKLICDKIADICKKERISISLFFYVSELDRLLMGNLPSLGYHKVYLKDTLNLDIKWSNFDEYLESLPYDKRKDAKREIRKFSSSGVTISEENEFGNLSTEISNLYSKLHAKHNNGAATPYNPLFFKSLSQYAKEKARVFVAKKSNKILGFVLFLQQANVLDAYICGFDYEAFTKTDFWYFNLVYYEPIRLAINERIRKIHYRAGDYSTLKAKYRRGCKPERNYSFVRVHNRLLANLIRLLL
jgi:predicted N-acyltransferase